MIKPWLRFFRVVNLPTVPGDVLVGASVVVASSSQGVGGDPLFAATLFVSCLASVFMYMFGLAQNDILGAETDVGRPIPEGLISLAAAKTACGVCWLLVGLVAMYPHGRMPFCAFAYVLVMTGLVSTYNVKKRPILMGLCRGVNVAYGGAVVFFDSLTSGRDSVFPLLWLGACAAVWTVYIAAVTRYSEGEEMDTAKKRRVGFLIGAIVYLHLLVLVAAYLYAPNTMTRGALLGGAAMLFLLRILKRLLPEVSAS